GLKSCSTLLHPTGWAPGGSGATIAIGSATAALFNAKPAITTRLAATPDALERFIGPQTAAVQDAFPRAPPKAIAARLTRPRSELFVGERENALASRQHGVLQRRGLRQVVVGVEARGGDLGAIKIGVAVGAGKTLRGR